MATYREISIKIGQVWRTTGSKITYTINRIEYPYAHAMVYDPDYPESGSECSFISMTDKSGKATISDLWHCDTDMTSQSRECICGIFRGDCTYHKDP